MLENTRELKGLEMRATDGVLGIVDQFYFDDNSWTIRYLTVETGGEMSIHRVLISPVSIRHVDWRNRFVEVDLTKTQVANSPTVETHQPISRQREEAHSDYYGYPRYWASPNADASHLRSKEEVVGYHIDATDGEIGHVDGFLVNDEDWSLRYMEVATLNWWPGKKVLLPPTWIEGVRWEDSKVLAGVTREAIRTAPAYDDSMPVTREYEELIYSHYAQEPYWRKEPEIASVRAF